MKKVVIISNGIGIVYKFRLELVKKLIDEGMEVFIISPIEEADKVFNNLLEKEKVKIYQVELNRRGKNILQELNTLLQYYKILKEINPDKVLTYTIKPNIYGGIICQILKLRYIPSVTGIGTAFQGEGILKKIVVFLNKIAMQKADKVFFQNTANLEIYLKNKIVKNKNCKLVNGSGVNLERFNYNIKGKKEVLKILFIGRIMKEKGIEEYLKVVKLLKEKYFDKIEFQILGQFEEEKYEKEIKELEERNILKYLGISKDVRKEISEVHCLVNPSWHEGMSNVLLEAGAMKRFLIASNIPGCREIVVNNKTGFTFEKQDVEDLTNKVEKFINLSKDEYEEYINNLYEYIKNNFDRNVVVKEYLKIINL